MGLLAFGVKSISLLEVQMVGMVERVGAYL
jgi:hypothetical protein